MALFLAVFVTLMLCWPIVGGAYGGLFRSAGNAVVGLGSHGRVWFAKPEGSAGEHDTQLVIVDPSTRTQRQTDLSSRRHGYMPTALLVALALATPIAWRPRLWLLLWGLLGVQTYVGIKLLLLPVAYGADGGAWSTASAMRSLLWVLSATTVGWALVPVLIWLTLLLLTAAKPTAR